MDFRYETVIPNDDLPFSDVYIRGRDGNYRVKQALAPVSGAVPCAGGNTGFFH